MTTKDIINDKLNQLEQSLINQDHLNNPIEFLTQLASPSKYFHLMSDEDVNRFCEVFYAPKRDEGMVITPKTTNGTSSNNNLKE